MSADKSASANADFIPPSEPPKTRTPLAPLKQKIIDIYSRHYPLKKGKSKGVAMALRTIKNEDDLKNFETAVKKYAADCVNSRTEAKYIKHFSSFVSIWTDWLDGDVGTSDPIPLPSLRKRSPESYL